MLNVKAQFPQKLAFLFKPARYKVLHGGRGGTKSWGVARALLIEGTKRPERILCAREFQVSIKDSVHKLLSDQIAKLGLSAFYEIQNTSIKGKNGTEFIFKGLRMNAEEIKSTEGITKCWVEEADKVSKTSWEFLIPTIRADGSEIWITFNPQLEEDETYKRFVLNPPSSAVVVRVNWSDNPWFPDVLRQEKDELRQKDPDAYLNVWEGHCRQMLDGAVYARELRAATESGRICKVPYDATKPVHTFWDLGWSDSTAIWFAQVVGFEYRILEYLEANQRTIQYFLQQLQSKGYVYGTDYLPHDAASKTLSSGGRSIEQLMKAAGRKVHVLPRIGIAEGLNAARTVFPNCWFDEEKCADGLQCLRRYRYEIDPDTNAFDKKPLHDQFSHGADAFRALAMSLTEKKETKLNLPPVIKTVQAPFQGQTRWMR